MQRYRLAIQYNGTPYSGWQKGADSLKPAVQDVLESAIHSFVGKDNCGVCQISSRTDSGVHALHNVLHLDLIRRARQVGDVREPHTPETVRRALNHLLQGSEIQVLNCRVVAREGAEAFHARYGALERRYIYRLLSGRSVFEAKRAWCLGLNVTERRLDVAAMHAAAQALVGEHMDFTSFRGKDCQAQSPVKIIRSIDVVHASPDPFHPHATCGDIVHVCVRAQSFLYHMVRNITGALHAVGLGRLPPSAILDILRARDRGVAPPMAPAQGLYLERVLYKDDSEEAAGGDPWWVN
ncbi:hypothetical protein NSK_001491 [Nannochloropsis salina CCMP1776]|uniref:tRNA pseudouridine synthase n=1 Tax=Nannochloropsis salina CCMP1776 TaxID=1027361 RepID=A0A4D9DER8_9STRA|nr:hypothetical protein NSK_001491 [Nannochloropsis salina CCMP1776]|eukprot:TFJ87159.1 hypothetical protein NSK_001491 [Nannochloropsis salina CCMP1776]